jgi:hypothetical protein
MFDTQEMFAHNRQAAFGQQEMNVGHAAMLAVFDGDDGAIGTPSFTASSASSKLKQGKAAQVGAYSSAARCELHPGAP